MARDEYRTLPTRTEFPALVGGRLVKVPGDKNHTPRPGGRHNITCTEQDCPGVYEIRCTCGEVTWTPWGAESADDIACLHLHAVGVPMRVRWG